MCAKTDEKQLVRQRDARLTPEQHRLLKACSILDGRRGERVKLDPSSLHRIMRNILAGVEGLRMPASFTANFTDGDPIPLYLAGCDLVPDFDRALSCLAEVRKRELKFKILAENLRPAPVEDIAARALIGHAAFGTEGLADILRHNKALYDLDNRLAQETGLLLTRIIAAALGGISHQARTSPIRRMRSAMERRSVDCIAGQRAYDIKARLTEAPSRRARFADEQQFARDCHASGFTPVLLVLRKCPGERPDDLIATYHQYGGEVYVEDQAWRHILEHAGPGMTTVMRNHVLPMFDLMYAQAGRAETAGRTEPGPEAVPA